MPAKAFACICVTIFYTLYGSGLLAQGGKDVQQPKNPGSKPIKCPFLPNKKLLTVMKFSRTNLLNCFVFCTCLIYKYLKIKSRISKVLCIFSKENISLLLNDTLLCKRPVLIYLHARELFMFYFRLLTFFKIKFLKIKHPGPPSECQTIWIQIKTDIMLAFILVQTVCKRLLADDKIIPWYAKCYNR